MRNNFSIASLKYSYFAVNNFIKLSYLIAQSEVEWIIKVCLFVYAYFSLLFGTNLSYKKNEDTAPLLTSINGIEGDMLNIWQSCRFVDLISRSIIPFPKLWISSMVGHSSNSLHLQKENIRVLLLIFCCWRAMSSMLFNLKPHGG